jgi:imidazolonepropionase-like amidohydrolase
MTDDVVERLAESGIPLCPTLTLIANLHDFGHLVGVPQRKKDAYARLLFEYAGPALTKAHAAGARFLAGTDSGFAVTPYGEWHARELELLMDYAGLSSLEAISAATSNAAFVLGLEGRVGVVAEGMIADLLVVDGDPVADIRVLQDRDRLIVIADGKVQTFEDDDPRQRWAYDRNQTISLTEITQHATRSGVEDAVTQTSNRWAS